MGKSACPGLDKLRIQQRERLKSDCRGNTLHTDGIMGRSIEGADEINRRGATLLKINRPAAGAGLLLIDNNLALLIRFRRHIRAAGSEINFPTYCEHGIAERFCIESPRFAAKERRAERAGDIGKFLFPGS